MFLLIPMSICKPNYKVFQRFVKKKKAKEEIFKAYGGVRIF